MQVRELGACGEALRRGVHRRHRPFFEWPLPVHDRGAVAASQGVLAGMEIARLAPPIEEGAQSQHPCACFPSKYLAPLPAALSPPQAKSTLHSTINTTLTLHLSGS